MWNQNASDSTEATVILLSAELLTLFLGFFFLDEQQQATKISIISTQNSKNEKPVNKTTEPPIEAIISVMPILWNSSVNSTSVLLIVNLNLKKSKNKWMRGQNCQIFKLFFANSIVKYQVSPCLEEGIEFIVFE